jgi:hypothetical protein
MHCALHVSGSEELQRIARIHGQRRILRLHPLPLVRRRVPDLQRRDRLAEQQCEAAKIYVVES